MREKYSGYTLIEMLATIAIIGIALPIIFNVLINSFNSLSKIGQIRMTELKHQQFTGRLRSDFDNIFRIYQLENDFIDFTTIRNNQFQDRVEYILRDNAIYYKVNGSDEKRLFIDLVAAQTKFEFKNYDDSPYSPGNGIAFTAPEMNALDKLVFKYSFLSNDNQISGQVVKILELE